MPTFEVRLEDPDSDEFRITTLTVADEAAARAFCEDSERSMVAFRVDPAEEKQLRAMAERDAKRAADEPAILTGRDKARLHTHRQAKPYAIKSVREVE
jgi:hypothetical protein